MPLSMVDFEKGSKQVEDEARAASKAEVAVASESPAASADGTTL